MSFAPKVPLPNFVLPKNNDHTLLECRFRPNQTLIAMKKFVYTMLAFLACTLTAGAQNVFIPDANLKAILIEEGVDTNDDGEISVAEAEAETSLGIWTYLTPVNDITGLQAFINLEYLAIGGYTGTVNVSNHPQLRFFFSSNGNITNIDLSPCPLLTTCAIHQSPLVSINVTGNPYLQGLFITDCGLTQIDISQNEELVDLDLSGNNLTQLDVRNKIFLNNLMVADNMLTGLDLTGTPYLELLLCDSNQLTSLDLRPEESLDYLNCRGNMDLEVICVNDVGEAEQAVLEERYKKSDFMAWSENCVSTAAITETALPEVKIFPNPATNVVFVEGDFTSVRLFDMQGKECVLRGMGKMYDVSVLKSGVYHLLLTSAGGTVHTARLLKK